MRPTFRHRRNVPSAPSQYRAVFDAPMLAEAVSVWVRLIEKEGGYEITLLHDYPDLVPQSGWLVMVNGLDLEVLSVDGRQLTCVERS